MDAQPGIDKRVAEVVRRENTTDELAIASDFLVSISLLFPPIIIKTRTTLPCLLTCLLEGPCFPSLSACFRSDPTILTNEWKDPGSLYRLAVVLLITK